MRFIRRAFNFTRMYALQALLRASHSATQSLNRALLRSARKTMRYELEKTLGVAQADLMVQALENHAKDLALAEQVAKVREAFREHVKDAKVDKMVADVVGGAKPGASA